ncbi:hypothetical protein DL98DRAFT_631497 [Cadophora sp. DSE1049]|nr:hypothetical protein DL98DRAFT_631497 [Cadophora sp. DSE1049]
MAVDPRLLQDTTDLGNLCFARKVNGSYNVVFQGAANTLITMQNDFQWVENYAMGAVVKVVDGAHVGGATSVQPIQAGQACTWTATSGDMPIPGPAPPPPDFPEGSFGTVGMPFRYHGAVYSQTGDNTAWSCIYVDANPKPGLDKISYIPKNEFSLFFDTSLETSSLLTHAAGDALEFSIPTNKYQYFVGWDYGTNDPGKWIPTKASALAVMPVNSLGVTIYRDGSTNELEPDYIRRSRAVRGTDAVYGAASAEPLFTFRLGWDTEHPLSDEEQAYYAKTVASFLSMNCESSIHLQLQTVSTFLIGYTSLNSIGPDWLILEGADDAQKVQNMLQNLLANVSPEFAPAQVDWNYKTQSSKAISSRQSIEGSEWVQMVMQMGWPAAFGIAAAGAAAGYVGTKVLDVLKSSQINFEKATLSPSGEMVIVRGSYRANQTQVPTTIQQVNSVVMQEASRVTPVPGIPTPDAVFVIENMPAASLKRTKSIRATGTAKRGMDYNGNRANGYTNGYTNGVKAIYA